MNAIASSIQKNNIKGYAKPYVLCNAFYKH